MTIFAVTAHLADFGVCTVAAILASGLIAAQTAENRPRDPSAAKLIHDLAEPINPLERPDLYDTSGFKISDRNRALANSLVALGSAAVPDLETAFDQIEQQGQDTPFGWNSRWLLFAYARSRGREAYRRLHAMADNPKLRFLSIGLDQSLALALGLTSYVSASRDADTSHGFRTDPRYSLDGMILAWMQGNRTGMEKELGPKARVSLGALLVKRSWAQFENQMWHGATSSDCAVGFRFEIPGDWSKPAETLDQALENRRRYPASLDESPTEPKLETQFVDKAGNDCLTREIKFVLAAAVPNGTGWRYFVDDSDMEGLLRTISECALASR